ncbi:antibiotic biosynthesis monooxygenase [Trinickia dabaoshanensis]|uniref:Antibiotic biosynthesis monooxygenase n=1 Tax=Trinickia dabaoshanensis TaxID=564714 RepID=A0A2N7VNT1_9BURK|nr:putative quinol monooxygenase [Trinickia dabaoshanensis]PMS18843.1 antibiotic biosynthesis monooxygenase [Trinickia dabaoshanensis]
MSEQLTVIAFMRAKPGAEEELGRRLMELVEASRQETGCLNYDLHRSNTDPAVWCMYENWRSRVDLDAHFQTTYLQRFAQDKDRLLAGDSDMHYLSMVSAQAASRSV